MNVNIVVYHVKDLASAKPLFAALTGTEPYVESPYYIGFRSDHLEIGLAPAGYNGLTGPVPYWKADDIREAVKKLVESGATLQQDVTDIGGGGLIAVLRDPEGNAIGLRSF